METETALAKRTSLDAKFERRKALVEGAIDMHHKYLFAYSLGLTRNHHDSEDLLSSLWKTVLLHFPEKNICKIGILRRKCYQLFCDFYRYRRVRKEVLTDTLPEVPVQPVKREPETDEEEKMLEASFWSEFPSVNLSDLQKRCLMLSARHGFTIMEISEKLDVPKSTVGDWLQLAKREIKDVLER